MYIAIDFDGTIVAHRYPRIGNPVPGALNWMKQFQEAGAKLILWTMRSGQELQDAIDYCEANGVVFHAHNNNPSQADWTESPKCYAHWYVDDSAFGCPLRENPAMGGRPFVDWDVVGPQLLEIIANDKP